MLELTRYLILISLLMITAFVFIYMRYHADYRDGLFYKTKDLLLYGYLKACITWEYGKHYTHILMKSIFTNYHAEDEHMKEIQRKTAEIQQVKEHMNLSEKRVHNHSGYNLKILK